MPNKQVQPEADPRPLDFFRFVTIADGLKLSTIVSKKNHPRWSRGFELASGNDMKLYKQVWMLTNVVFVHKGNRNLYSWL